jgi:hypothetical protein
VSVASRAARIASGVTGLENPEPPRSFCSIVCLFVFVTKKCRGREQRPAFPFAVPASAHGPRRDRPDRGRADCSMRVATPQYRKR